LSTLGQPHPEPAWKQEVSRRIAAHKSRKQAPSAAVPVEHHALGSSRAAQAAARVAARYAKAPSYTQMQAEEARVAVRAAEIATQVALEAQAAAQSALAELHAAAIEAPSRGPAVVESITRVFVEPVEEVAVAVAEPEPVVAEPELPCPILSSPSGESVEDLGSTPRRIADAPVIAPGLEPEPVITRQIVDGQSFGIRWEPDTPVRVLQPRPAPKPEPFELAAEDWWTPAQVSATLRHEPISVDSQPSAANLIEFPRELVASRKMRPRLLQPAAAAPEAQLSIFEVDPGTISTDPWSEESAVAIPETAAHEWSPSAPSAAVYSPAEWSGPRWSGMELDEHPQSAMAVEAEPAAAPQPIFLAPLGRRLLALVVDGALILACFFAGAMALACRISQVPAPRTAELLGVVGLVLAGFLYHALFFALRVSTPGMRYAGIALSTFDDESPTRAQLRRRLGAMTLSMLPVGLGFAWAVFDEDHLSWHDRISQTYLRKR